MLFAPALADRAILPKAWGSSYFFNRIGQKQPLGCVYKTGGDSKTMTTCASLENSAAGIALLD